MSQELLNQVKENLNQLDSNLDLLEMAMGNVLNGFFTLVAIQGCEPITSAVEEEIAKRFVNSVMDNPNNTFNEKAVISFPNVLRNFASKLELQTDELKVKNLGELEKESFLN